MVGGRTSWCCGVKKRGQTIPPSPNRQLPIVNPLPSNTFRTWPQRANYCTRLRLRSLELRGRQPARYRGIVCDGARRSHRDTHLLRHAVKAERRLVLITRLVIALLVVDVLLLHAPLLGTPDKVDARLYR